MSASIWLWVIFVVSCLFGGWASGWPLERKAGTWIVVMILLALLGWRVFGPVVQ